MRNTEWQGVMKMNLLHIRMSDLKNWLKTWPLHPIIQGVCGLFAVLILIYGGFQRGPELLKYPTTLLIGFSLGLAVVWIGVFKSIEKCRFLHKPFVFPVLVTGIALVPRYIWIRLVETTPMWDFARYFNYAVSIVNGNPGAISDIRGVFPHLTGYPLMLSYVLRIFGTEVEVARWFNLFCTLISILLLYQLGKIMFSPKTGRAAALLFAFWPGQIFYSAVLGAEHLFTMQFLFVLLLFFYCIREKKQNKSILLAVATAMALTFAHVVRPVASLLFPAFFLYLLILPLETNKEECVSGGKKKAYVHRGILFVVILLTFIGSLQGLNRIYEPMVQVPLGKTGAGFNLYVGTNKESQGMWSAEDWEIIKEYHYDFQRIHEEGWNRGVERIKEDYIEFLLLAEQKFSIQWSVSDYGLYWGLLETDRVTAVSLWAEEYRQELQVASQVFYMSLIWLIAFGAWKETRRNQVNAGDFIAVLFFGFIAMHTLIEVQSRYHHSLMPLFMLLAVGNQRSEILSPLRKNDTISREGSLK